VTLPDAGSYRVFADFSVGRKPYTLADDLTVDGAVRSQRAARARDERRRRRPARALTEGASRAARSHSWPSRHARRRPVAIEDYLGAKGHLVALRGAISPSCTCTPTRTACVHGRVPDAGRYRLFLQFKTTDAACTPPLSPGGDAMSRPTSAGACRYPA
jgi:hypothetical protein